MLNVKLTDNAAEDSYSFLPALRGQANHARRDVIHHSVSGYFAIRRDNWKLSCCPASGGWTGPRPSAASWEKFKLAGLPMVQLINMKSDLGEMTNLARQQPDKVKSLHALLDEQVSRGRSTPGKPQANDATIVVDKQPGTKKRKEKAKAKNKKTTKKKNRTKAAEK